MWSCQWDIHWLDKRPKTLCQQQLEVRQVGGHGVGLEEEKKEWLLKGIIIFLLWDSAGSNQAENAFTIDIQSGRMCCWSSPIGSLALVEATVLNRDLTYVDVADDFAMHRDILTDEQPAKQSVYNTAKNSWLCLSEMADEVWQRLKSRSRRHKQNQEE